MQLFFILVFMLNSVFCMKPCCPLNTTLHWVGSEMCSDKSPVNLHCDLKKEIIVWENLTAEQADSLKDIHIFDSDDKKCVTNFTALNETVTVMIFCDDTLGRAIDKIKHEQEPRHFADAVRFEFASVLFIINIISIIGSVIAVYLYFWLPSLQDIHGTCVFHFCLNTGLLHGIVLYYSITADTFFPDILCIVELNISMFVILATFSWSVVLSYNTWKQAKGNQIVDEIKRLNYYRTFGYGVPGTLVLVSVVYSHLPHSQMLMIDYLMGSNCSFYVFGISLIFTVLLTPFVNLFYFVDSQRRLWSLYNSEFGNSKSFLKKLKYKIYLNLRLCLVMNIPLAIFVVLFLLLKLLDVHVDFFLIFIPFSLLFASEGALIFLSVVVFRKRVIKGFVNHGRNSCMNCLRSSIPSSLINMKDEETESEQEECPEEEQRVQID